MATERLERINELAKKQKEVGLTPEEKERRAKEFAERSIEEATATNAEVIKEMKEGK